MVSTNPTAHILTGSSNNAILLGNVLQGKASFFYVLKYLQKDKVQLQASLISLEQAAKHVEKYKSIASDSGSAKRKVQHMFTRAVSDLTRSVQISDTQVALCLLNTGTEVTSDSFGYFGASFNTNYIVDHCKRKQVGSLDDGDDSDAGSDVLHSVNATDSDEDDSDSGSTVLNLVDSTDSTDSFSCAQEFPEEDVEIEVPDSMLDVIIPESSSSSKSFGPAPFYKVPDKSDAKEKTKAVPVHYPAHYWFRGEQLAQLTAFEYAAMVQVVPQRSHWRKKFYKNPTPIHKAVWWRKKRTTSVGDLPGSISDFITCIHCMSHMLKS
jgi:hypothetical protein